MRATHKKSSDGSEQLMLGAVIMEEKPARKRARRHDLPFSLENLRMREIESIIRHRHGNGIPDPAGTDDVELCHSYLRAVAMTPSSQAVASWALVWAPWADPVTLMLMDKDEADRERMLPADAVAKLLFVTMAERTALGLKTIGACDMSWTDRHNSAKERKRERDRNRQERKRAEKGSMDRASYEAASLAKLKPWVAEGISRRTWERRRVASPSQVDIYSMSDTLASTAEGSAPVQQTENRTRAAGLVVGLGDHPPAEFQEAAPHGSGDRSEGLAA